MPKKTTQPAFLICQIWQAQGRPMPLAYGRIKGSWLTGLSPQAVETMDIERQPPEDKKRQITTKI